MLRSPVTDNSILYGYSGCIPGYVTAGRAAGGQLHMAAGAGGDAE